MRIINLLLILIIFFNILFTEITNIRENYISIYLFSWCVVLMFCSVILEITKPILQPKTKCDYTEVGIIE